MPYEITPISTALLIIDAQREYFDPGRPLFTNHAREILPNLMKLRDCAERAGILTVLIQHSHRADGSDVGRMGDFNPIPLFIEGTQWVELISEMSPREGNLVIRKTRYSSFVQTDLQGQLTILGINTVIVTGLMTNYCCVTTARHAHDLDFRVVFVADANAGPDMPDLGFGPIPHSEMLRAVGGSLAGGVADVVSTDDLMKRMHPALRASG